MSSRHRTVSLLKLLVGSIALLSAVAGAAPMPPLWTRDFVSPIQWQRVTSLGHLLVSTANGLYAVDAGTGHVMWSQQGLVGLAESGVEELAGSPLVLITDAAENPRTVVLNAFNGAIVFDSRAANLGQISPPRVLPQSGSLLVAGFEAGKPQPMLFLYSIEDGRQLWKSDVLSAAANPGGSALLNLLMSAALVVAKIDPVQSPPLELGDGTFLLGAMGHVIRLDQATGKVLWKTPFAGGVFEFRQASARPDNVYVGSEETQDVTGSDQTVRESKQTLYQGFRLADGGAIWKRPVRFNKPMNRAIIPIDRGLIVSDGDRDKGKVQLLDYDTGAPLWGNKGRGIDISGQVLDYSFAGTDLVLTSGYDSIWTNKDTEYLLYVLDTVGGRFRFEKPFKVKGRMLGTELTDHGLIYVTTHEINVFDPATGGLRNESALRSKQPLVTAEAGQLVYAFNSDDGHVYRFDRATGAVSQFSKAPFAFVDNDRARALDFVDDSVVLLGQQTVAGFGADGTLRFSTHYRAPRNPGWVRALAWAEGVRAGMASASAGIYSAAAASAAADAPQGSVSREVAVQLQQGFGALQQGYAGLAGDYVRYARRRYEASAESRDFVFVMAQGEDQRVSLVQVSKRDGRTLAEIDLRRDREPEYQVDDIGSFVFYRSSESAVAAYGFAEERIEVSLK